MFNIGEFSKIIGLSVKTLRLYHEKEVLRPAHVDEETGYRYYDANSIERARVVLRLREMEFSLSEIKEILENHGDDSDILAYLEKQKKAIAEKIRRQSDVLASLDRIITAEKEAKRVMAQSHFEVQERVLDAIWIAGVRMKGKYRECGKGFAKIGRQMGRQICGKPFCLYYDAEYREEDADFEACFPVRKGNAPAGISVRELPGGRCLSLLHKGPYEELGRSYARILAYAREKGCKVGVPSREVYVKGPGMIFKGNPKNYLTEIQILVEP